MHPESSSKNLNIPYSKWRVCSLPTLLGTQYWCGVYQKVATQNITTFSSWIFFRFWNLFYANRCLFLQSTLPPAQRGLHLQPLVALDSTFSCSILRKRISSATQWTPCEALNCRPHSFESFCWQRILPNDTPKERQHRCGTDNMPPGQRVGANFDFIFLPCRTDSFHQVVSYVQSVAVSAGKPGLGKLTASLLGWIRRYFFNAVRVLWTSCVLVVLFGSIMCPRMKVGNTHKTLHTSCPFFCIISRQLARTRFINK